jgi:hypothetical protein
MAAKLPQGTQKPNVTRLLVGLTVLVIPMSLVHLAFGPTTGRRAVTAAPQETSPGTGHRQKQLA